MATADQADSASGADTTTNDTTIAGEGGVDAVVGAPSADAIAAAPAAVSAPIPPPPPKGAARKPAARKSAAKAADAIRAQPVSPAYQFEPQGGPTAGASQDLTAAMVEQLAADPVVAVDGERWTDDTGPRGRVISVSRGPEAGPTTTFEETLPPGCTEDKVAAARQRLRARFGA